MNDYYLVDCDFHDQLEALATLRQMCQICYSTITGEIVEVQSQIIDVYSANKADFLKLKDGTEVRLDHLVSVNGQPIQFAYNNNSEGNHD
jgi:Rho-binding antiterminator